MTRARSALLVLLPAVAVVLAGQPAAQTGAPRFDSAAAVTADDRAVVSIEDGAAFSPSPKRRVVIVASFDDPEAEPRVREAVRWFSAAAPDSVRSQWSFAALPSSPRSVAPRLARWATLQAPDLIVEIGGAAPTWAAVLTPEATAGLGAAPVVAIGMGGDLGGILSRTLGDAPTAHATVSLAIAARVTRDPLAIARVLARRYPETPAISYIPAVAWSQTLRLAGVVRDESLREKVRQQTRPWIAGEKKLFGDRVQLTAVAGTMIFAELAAAGDAGAAPLAEQGATLAAAEKAGSVAEYGQGWTDDMFMGTSVLARTGAQPGHEKDLDTAAHRLIAYASRLQRPDGLFNHATDGPVAWGRGNGFAALGLIDALTRLPDRHPDRETLLGIYRRQMAAALVQQAPDGMWRQIIDEPGAYREETATAMLLSAMARGVRLGWLDRSYAPAVQRAWRALAAHVADDGTVVDVCANTGAGPTRRYYFDRPAVTGADDRGGAMALLASMEIYELGNAR